jgi:hypothetical protein
MSDLMQKLAMSKQIMDRHKEIPRGHSAGMPNMVNESIPNAKYNIPQEMVSESVQKPVQMPPQQMDESRILNSKLPEHIKKLMIENPIQQPSFGLGGPVLSDEIIEGAAKLMGVNPKQQQQQQPQVSETTQSQYSNNDLKQMIRDVVRDTVRDVVKEELQKVGMISEGQTTNESLQLRIGSHIFEGKVTKMKKIK